MMHKGQADSTDFYRAIPSNSDAMLDLVPDKCKSFVQYQFESVQFCKDEISKHRNRIKDLEKEDQHMEEKYDAIHTRLAEGKEEMAELRQDMTKAFSEIQRAQKNALVALISFMSLLILSLVGTIITLVATSPTPAPPATTTQLEKPHVPQDPSLPSAPPVYLGVHLAPGRILKGLQARSGRHASNGTCSAL